MQYVLHFARRRHERLQPLSPKATRQSGKTVDYYKHQLTLQEMMMRSFSDKGMLKSLRRLSWPMLWRRTRQIFFRISNTA